MARGPENSGRRLVMVVTSDLLARARLEDAATRAGWALEGATTANLHERLGSVRPDVLVLDLDAGRTELLALLAPARDAGLLGGRVIGFLSHVDTDLAAAAASAGCEVIPRGKLWRTLPALLADEPRNDPPS